VNGRAYGKATSQVSKEPAHYLHRRRLDDDLHPVESLYPADGRGHRAPDNYPETVLPDNIVDMLSHDLAGGLEPLVLHVFHPDNRHPPVRRQVAFFPMRQLGLEELVQIVLQGKPDRGLMGQQGLHDHRAPFCGPARTTRHLANKLEGPFIGAEIRYRQGRVGTYDPHKRDIGKVQTLGQHLCAGKDVDLAGGEVAQHALR